jgi:hypothetical protein
MAEHAWFYVVDEIGFLTTGTCSLCIGAGGDWFKTEWKSKIPHEQSSN